MNNTQKQPKKQPTLTDSTGLEIPVKIILKHTLNAHKTACKIFAEAEKLQAQIIEKKYQWLKLTDDWYAQLLEHFNANKKDTDKMKGNYSLFSYDKKIKIEINMSERIEFDSNLKIAKLKSDEYKAAISEGANQDICIILNHAFTTSKGNLDTKQILSLISYGITHPLWIEMIDAIKLSISKNVSKRYMAIFKKDDEGKYVPFTLQFSAL